MKIFIASDHAGFDTKTKVFNQFNKQYEFIDVGPPNDERVDYPDFADKVIQLMSSPSDRGVLICGSGQGMAIRANKYPNIRAALCWSEESAQLARAHNDANVLCLAGRLTETETLFKIFEVFLKTPFEGGRHAARVEKISKPVP